MTDFSANSTMKAFDKTIRSLYNVTNTIFYPRGIFFHNENINCNSVGIRFCTQRDVYGYSLLVPLCSSLYKKSGICRKFTENFLSPPAILKRFLSLKTQNLAVKSFSENHYTFSQKNSELMNINVKLHENKDVYFFCRKQQNLHSQYFCGCCKKDQYLHKCCYWNGICFCDILFRHWLYNLWRFF